MSVVHYIPDKRIRSGLKYSESRYKVHRYTCNVCICSQPGIEKMRRQPMMTDRQLKVIKGEEAAKDCSITIPFNQVYPKKTVGAKQRWGTDITSGQHESQCSNVTVTRVFTGDDPGAVRSYNSTFIDLGCKSVNWAMDSCIWRSTWLSQSKFEFSCKKGGVVWTLWIEKDQLPYFFVPINRA